MTEETSAVLFYQLLAQNTKAIVLFVSADGRIIEANRAAAEAYGFDRSSLIGLRYTDLEANPLAGGELRTLFEAGFGQTVILESEQRRANGRSFPVEVTGSTAEIDGEPVLLCLVRDLTSDRRRAATQRLQHALDRLILQKQPLEVILQNLCTELSILFHSPLVWVGLEDPENGIKVGASAGECSPLPKEGMDNWAEADHIGLVAGHQVLTVPLVAHDQRLGALVLNTEDGTLDADTRDILTALVDQVSISILAARDQEQIRLQTTALESAANAIVITNRNGKILWVNPAWTRLTGYSSEETIGQTPRILRSGHHPEAFFRDLWETITSGQNWEGQIQNRRKDGSIYVDEQTITPVRNGQGEITHFIAIKQDVTDRKWHEEQLRHLATHDPLTGLPNRRMLREELDRLVTRASHGGKGALLLIDVDDFKVVNDTHGHLVGDRLLSALAAQLRNALRPSDLLARLGGDEFAALLEGAGSEEAQKIAERLRKLVGEYRFRIEGPVDQMSLSIGIAPIDGLLTPDGVVALADSALYRAKKLGKNRAVFFPPGQEGSHGLEESMWATRIKNALQRNGFVLHFQPVVCLATEQQEHFEALVRLEANGEIILPGKFLPAAERFGLMPQIDRWVLDHVLSLLTATPALNVFVNLNGQSLGDDELLSYIEDSIKKSRIRTGQLCLEITETVAVRNLNLLQAWMERLQNLGCQFALDDFGTGFSSFAYLRSLPVNYVKIDGSFVRNLDRDATSRSLVEAMRTVCHTLGKKVIAEWVESEQVVAILRSFGIEYGQGFLWGLPGPNPGDV